MEQIKQTSPCLLPLNKAINYLCNSNLLINPPTHCKCWFFCLHLYQKFPAKQNPHNIIYHTTVHHNHWNTTQIHNSKLSNSVRGFSSSSKVNFMLSTPFLSSNEFARKFAYFSFTILSQNIMLLYCYIHCMWLWNISSWKVRLSQDHSHIPFSYSMAMPKPPSSHALVSPQFDMPPWMVGGACVDPSACWVHPCRHTE